MNALSDSPPQFEKSQATPAGICPRSLVFTPQLMSTLRAYHIVTAVGLTHNLQADFWDIVFYLPRIQINTNKQLINHTLHFKVRNVPTELNGSIHMLNALGSVT